MDLLLYITFAALVIIIDGIYLSTFGNTFAKMIERIQHSTFRVNIIGAGLSYSFILLALYYFVIRINGSVLDAFLLGLFMYGLFDFTNLALFNKYDWKIGAIDTLWGGILFATVTFIFKLIRSHVDDHMAKHLLNKIQYLKSKIL